MSYNGQLAKQAKFIFISGPADYNASAATTEWIDMSKYSHVTFLIQTGAWAGGTGAVTLNQAKTNAGASTSVSFAKMFTNKAAPTTDTLVETTVTSDTFDLDTAASIWLVEVNATMLDVSGGYRWLNLAVGTCSGNNIDFYSVLAIADKGRYISGVASPSAIA